jgi:ferritin-like metal-binding protein YciE
MKLRTMEDLFTDQLKDLYSAENQIIKALPKMAKAAENAQLRSAFEEHLEQTRRHAERLEQIFERCGISGKGIKCKAVEGLIEEGKEVMEEDGDPTVLDAALIAAAQRVEHYEIAGYGCARTYARLLGDDESTRLLQQTLDEEAQTDKKLTQIAESAVNVRAVGAGA